MCQYSSAGTAGVQLLQTTTPNKQGNKLSFRATSSHLYQRYVFFARRTLSQISPAAPGLLLETVRVSLFKQLHDTCRQCSRKIYAITCHRIAVSYPMSSKCIKPKSSLSGESKATKPPTSKKEQSSSRPRSKNQCSLEAMDQPGKSPVWFPDSQVIGGAAPTQGRASKVMAHPRGR